jgi:hypothetical protein
MGLFNTVPRKFFGHTANAGRNIGHLVRMRPRAVEVQLGGCVGNVADLRQIVADNVEGALKVGCGRA